MRPTCAELLQKTQLTRNMPSQIVSPNEQNELSLIGTIRVPRNLAQITERLPESNYATDQERRRQQDRVSSLPPTINQVMDQYPNQNNDYTTNVPGSAYSRRGHS